MPSPPLLKFEALTAPIPGPTPAGEEGAWMAVKTQFDELRKEDDPASYSPKDPSRPATKKNADWAGITKLAQELLTTRSKDLRIATRLTEALVQLHGFPGLRDGLQLLRVLADQCWDRLNPPVEDGDLEMRAGPINSLDDYDRGSRFSLMVRSLPVVKGAGQACSQHDWDQIEKNPTKARIKKDEFNAALTAAAATPEFLELAADFQQARDEVTQLVKVLEAKMGRESSPGLSGLSRALEDWDTIIQRGLRTRPGAAAETSGGAGVATAANGQASSSRPSSRQEIYAQLTALAEQLRRLEPHSPIPYLVERAVALGEKPFPDMMQELIRDQNTVKEMFRELRINTPAAPK